MGYESVEEAQSYLEDLEALLVAAFEREGLGREPAGRIAAAAVESIRSQSPRFAILRSE